ncbi:DUF2004 domain-containing protein [Muricauda oceani]|uniref:DUF2004 domain-containing protein n=1 Tax=Flagellimonas oceani TaxID=2698672 RepID=A0A6G7J327_9FLAO|nr:DUF2004 domain-containing protein [Allomuricauda oceani]MBW8244032.1 DUF2004 domain-containing protein [Allomuricauda oceani]QII45009.1 DUF2004 domain-containing protein [Allomuricauda oceani]
MKQILIIAIMFSFFGCKNKTEELPYFGTITLSNARDYEIENIKINNNNVSIDLNFELDKINRKTLSNVRSILESLESIDKQNQNKFRNYISEDGMVQDYFNFYIQEYDFQQLNNYLNDADQSLLIELRLLNATKLKRVGIYPDSPSSFAVLDYKVFDEYSDQILVVVLNEKGEIEKITIES